tara:strand:+ start:1738 stop:1872 length:135 start_codon:yes stop_codon:yes gene_type:complete
MPNIAVTIKIECNYRNRYSQFIVGFCIALTTRKLALKKISAATA